MTQPSLDDNPAERASSMPIRPSVRFDVFKRDNFTCAYCGRRPPEVTLEVDHIIPLAEGGDHDPANLATSCSDCNRGKGAVPLTSEPPAIPDLAERTELIREREAQLRAYHTAKAEEAQRRDGQFDHVWNYWFEIWDTTEMDRSHTPYESTLRRYIDLLGPDEVMDAMRITAERRRYLNATTVRYFVGVLKGKHAKLEGRETKCIYCGKWMRLDPGEDAAAEWYHVTCKEAADTDG